MFFSGGRYFFYKTSFDSLLELVPFNKSDIFRRFLKHTLFSTLDGCKTHFYCEKFLKICIISMNKLTSNKQNHRNQSSTESFISVNSLL